MMLEDQKVYIPVLMVLYWSPKLLLVSPQCSRNHAAL